MKRALFLIIALLLVKSTFAQDVSNVSFIQRSDGSYKVDIYYDLSGDTSNVSISVSNDGGASWDFAVNTLTGDTGNGIAPGTGKHIIWDFWADHAGEYSKDYLIKITVDSSDSGTVVYGGKVYHTVQIGEQIWLKENLNIGVMISVSSDQTNNGVIEKYCYNNDTVNCDIYGGLYQWNEAMKYSELEGNQGICPDGWHIPTSTEYQLLITNVYANGNSLKAIGQGNGNGLGTNESGFTGLLAGDRETYTPTGGYFSSLGLYAYIWSSTLYDNLSPNKFGLNANDSIIVITPHPADKGYSIRCIKDNNQPSIPNLLSPLNKSVGQALNPTIIWNTSNRAESYTLQVSSDSLFGSFIINQSGITDTSYQISGLENLTKYFWRINAVNAYGTSNWSYIWSFTTLPHEKPCPGVATIEYAGKIYNTVQIGDQCWLKENLNVGISINNNGSFENQTNNGIVEKYCYNYDSTKCQKYGGLYQWDEAMQYNTIEGVQGICPDSWHIPTYIELQTLNSFIGNSRDALLEKGEIISATNTSGFSALLSGTQYYLGGNNTDLGFSTSFWSSTEYSPNDARNFYIQNSDEGNNFYNYDKKYGFSIRCILGEGVNVNPPSTPNLLLPSNTSVGQALTPTLIWNTGNRAESYSLQVSKDSLFGSYVFNQSSLADTSYQVSGLENLTKYFWRVNAVNTYGTSNWSAVWSFTTGNSCPGIATVEYAGKTYNTVQIGDQCWLKENLDVGTMINGSIHSEDNGIIEKFCYANNASNCDIYGGLYQWNEAMQYVKTEGAQGICPEGWHIPTIDETGILRSTVGDDGKALLAIGQGTGVNSSGFSALLAGLHGGSGGYQYLNLDVYLFMWNSTWDSGGSMASFIQIDGSNGNIIMAHNIPNDGFSIRCIKDTTTLSTGLVAFYPFNGNANDESSNGNDLSVNNADLITDRFGNNNEAYSFNGSNAFLSIDSLKGITPGNSAHSICGWVYISQLPPSPGRSWILLLGNPGTNTSEHWLLGNESSLGIGFFDIIGFNTPVTTGVWTFVCVTYDGNSLNGYINGEKVQSVNANDWDLSGIPLTFAKVNGTDPSEHYFQGRLDDFRIYNRVLSDDEIQMLLNEPNK